MSKYKKIIDDVVFSFSSTNLYDHCPYAFYCHKIEREKLSEGNFYSDAGGYAHKILEELFSGKINVGEAIVTWIDNYEMNIFNYEKESIVENKFYSFLEFLTSFDESLLDGYEIVGTEIKVEFEINSIKYIGFVDLLIRNVETDELILIDHKSTGHFLKKNGSPLKSTLSQYLAYKKQMYLYCKPIFEKYGKYPDKIVWNHFNENQTTVIEFDEDDYKSSLKWAEETVNKIYDDNDFLPCYEEDKYDFYCGKLCGFRNDCEYKGL